jgi:hypothetical protein
VSQINWSEHFRNIIRTTWTKFQINIYSGLYKSKIIILSFLFHCIIYHPLHICSIALSSVIYNVYTIYSQVWVWSVTCPHVLHPYIAHCQYLLSGGSFYHSLRVWVSRTPHTTCIFMSHRVSLVKSSSLQIMALHYQLKWNW